MPEGWNGGRPERKSSSRFQVSSSRLGKKKRECRASFPSPISYFFLHPSSLDADGRTAKCEFRVAGFEFRIGEGECSRATEIFEFQPIQPYYFQSVLLARPTCRRTDLRTDGLADRQTAGRREAEDRSRKPGTPESRDAGMPESRSWKTEAGRSKLGDRSRKNGARKQCSFNSRFPFPVSRFSSPVSRFSSPVSRFSFHVSRLSTLNSQL